MENTVMIVWDGCDSYVLSDAPVYKGSEVFNSRPAIATNLDSTDKDFDWQSFVLVGNVVYQWV